MGSGHTPGSPTGCQHLATVVCMTLEEELVELKSAQAKVQESLSVLKRRKKAVKLLIIAKYYNLTEGSIVVCKGCDYKVASVDPFRKGKPWVKGVKKLKGGEWGTRAYHLYTDWVIKE